MSISSPVPILGVSFSRPPLQRCFSFWFPFKTYQEGSSKDTHLSLLLPCCIFWLTSIGSLSFLAQTQKVHYFFKQVSFTYVLIPQQLGPPKDSMNIRQKARFWPFGFLFSLQSVHMFNSYVYVPICFSLFKL